VPRDFRDKGNFSSAGVWTKRASTIAVSQEQYEKEILHGRVKLQYGRWILAITLSLKMRQRDQPSSTQNL